MSPDQIAKYRQNTLESKPYTQYQRMCKKCKRPKNLTGGKLLAKAVWWCADCYKEAK